MTTEIMENGRVRGFETGLAFAVAFALVALLVGSKKNGNSFVQRHRFSPDRLSPGINRFAPGQFLGSGPARVSGRITGMNTAAMHADIPKGPGDTVNVSVTWTATTVDPQNRPRNWPYSLTANLFDSDSNQVAVGCVPTTCGLRLNKGNGTVTETVQITVPEDASGIYTVVVALFGARSLPDGTPSALDQGLASRVANDSIVVAAKSIPGGSLGTIALSQQDRILRRGR